MNKILLFLTLLFMVACPAVDPPAPIPTPTIEPLPFTIGQNPNGQPVELAVITEGYMEFKTGGELWRVVDGVVKSAKKNIYSIEREGVAYLLEFNEYGAVIDWTILNTAPIAITVKDGDSIRDITSGDEVWLLEEITPEESQAMGGLYRDHTRIWKNGVEVGAWNQNRWKADCVFVPGAGITVARNAGGSWHNLEGDTNIVRAYDGGIIINDVNAEAKTGVISDNTGNHPVTFTLNFFIGAYWQEAGGVWYSHNGYTWSSAAGLNEQVNELWGWNIGDYPTTGHPTGEIPLPIPAGVRMEGAEEVTYWLECNSGWLIRHVPSFDRVDIERRLYDGDYLRETGARLSRELDPVISGDHLYFNYDNEVRDYNFNTGEVTVFTGDAQIIPW